MPVILQVRDIREELYRAGDRTAGNGSAQGTTMLLGRLFHEVFAQLLEGDLDEALATLPTTDQTGWRHGLVHRTYEHLVEPRLWKQREPLQSQTEPVLGFWTAIVEICHWLADLAWTVREQARQTGTPCRLTDLVATEQSLCWELREPGWTDTVRLTGITDAVLRIPGSQRWCAIELKLGKTSPEIDLAQVCLYHEMLAAAEPEAVTNEAPAQGSVSHGRPAHHDLADHSAVALVSFHPQRHEQVFLATDLAVARQALVNLIGRMAGVLPGEAAPGPSIGPILGPFTGLLPGPFTGTSTEPHPRPSPESPVLLPPPSPPPAELSELTKRLLRTFEEYEIKVTLDGQPIVGPTFIRFPLQLGAGARFSALPKRAQEIQVRLELDAPPFMRIVDGHVVVDLQRPDRQSITIEQVESQFPRCEAGLACSRVPIGVDLDGQLQFADFQKPEHAHLLVAGTTGSGKSEWLRTAVAGLLMTNTPQTLRLLLIDPKRNAFHALRESPYLWRPIVYPDEQAVSVVLKELADEMDERYRQLDGADTFHQHANRQGITLPRIVCVCDEYADLVARGTKERKALEEQIFRLGAKARAAGIHLVLATQQPSRQIIKGALDTNMPARVALKTAKRTESTMLLEIGGAENLLGHGDLLFKDVGEPRRMQAVYIPPEQRERLFRGSGM